MAGQVPRHDHRRVPEDQGPVLTPSEQTNAEPIDGDRPVRPRGFGLLAQVELHIETLGWNGRPSRSIGVVMDETDRSSADLESASPPLATRQKTVHDEGGIVVEFSPDHLARGAPFAFGAKPRRHLPDALSALGRIFDNIATLQLRCAALEAEKAQTQRSSEIRLQDAFGRIQDLEVAVADLMTLVTRYERLLHETHIIAKEAEQRAFHAETRVRGSGLGSAEAVDWLYRYMSLPVPPHGLTTKRP